MIHIEFIDILLTIGFAQGIFFSLVLTVSRNNQAANRSLAVMMLLWALIPLEIFMLRSESYAQLPWLMGLFWPVSVALLPALWLYINLLLGQTSKHILWHFLPVIVYYCLLVPFFWQPAEVKLALLFESNSPGAGIWQLQVMSFIVLLQNVLYLPLALRKTRHYQARLKDVCSNLEKHNVHWLMLVIGTLMLAFIISIVGTFQAEWMLAAQSIMAVLVTFSLFYASFRSMTQAQIQDEQRIANEVPTQSLQAKPVIPAAIANPIAHALSDIMASQQPYLDYDISLSGLAKLIEVDRTLLSEVLNQHLNTKFYDYINQHRIEAAKTLMQAQDNKSPVTQIACEVGFKSRTTFYNAFKKHTGQTPSQWKQSLIK